MRPARLSRLEEGGAVRCLACAHGCTVAEGRTGLCGVRRTVKGKLQSLVYGLPASVALDPIEKKPLYHFLPGSTALSLGTFGCNFSCAFCQNY
ncbi:MAG: AmmeMemoRadiSam system radical SAM enzyme, partial [Caldiserica bacterium]|nr:AmmeMemoRadiSam system radical SAM enzyme [Caldisericota bacterium]